MLTGSIPLGRLAGAPLSVHWSAVLVAGFMAVGLIGMDVAPVAAVIGVIAFFVSILGHELAHAIVARRFGVGTTSIDLWALGGIARLDREPRSPKAEGWIAAAGPLASIVIGVVTFSAALAGARLGAPESVYVVLGWLGLLNGVLGFFNLLPGAPLDGGRIVRAVRWASHGNRYRAMREAGHAGRVIGWGLAALGLAMIVTDRTFGFWLGLTGVFIAINARAEVAFADVSERLGGITVGEMTWFGVAETGADMDADSMIWQRSRLGGAGAVAVRGEDGELDGLVLEDQLWAVPAEQRPWVMLTSLMSPFSRLAQADPDDELASVLPKLNPLRPIVTVWRDGRLLGVVPPKALRQKLQLLATPRF
jgi:Zn-dependent protease